MAFASRVSCVTKRFEVLAAVAVVVVLEARIQVSPQKREVSLGNVNM
jgi:hypothetical protein